MCKQCGKAIIDTKGEKKIPQQNTILYCDSFLYDESNLIFCDGCGFFFKVWHAHVFFEVHLRVGAKPKCIWVAVDLSAVYCKLAHSFCLLITHIFVQKL